ncbi:hypothetical protein CC86DRAFT_362637 [Ophiobolus disseminans]|uniref:Tc1-like transposase DDE domain-containing protein n=1 Tax=Ophiobolus disseminans TaxID=1469910 RepID=A0A6A6ZHC0_9PLEO|nr:hypothetical protein CC86DRAFT_362637 [Ophiobolus disseminans]
MHPAKSPDLNLIEGIWNIIKERVRCKLHNINTIDELKAALQQEWKAVPWAYNIQKYCTNMNKRCQAVQKAEGGHTPY